MCALTVAPLYCLVAVKCGKGAATDPELANWAEVKPLGPEGKVGCKVNPETREASTSKEEEEVEDILVVVRPGGGEVGNCFQQGSRGAGATLSLISPSHSSLSILLLSSPILQGRDHQDCLIFLLSPNLAISHCSSFFLPFSYGHVWLYSLCRFLLFWCSIQAIYLDRF